MIYVHGHRAWMLEARLVELGMICVHGHRAWMLEARLVESGGTGSACFIRALGHM